jgi:isoaspartyl peptidase/L-asparaginase-like protein (Ntn-hydrolase superfamily)
MRHLEHKPIIAAHAGVGSPNAYSDGTKRAVREALKTLKQTKSPLKAAIAGTVLLEDDPRFNAGTGANLRMDGQTIEMDAAVMDSDGNCGAVACIRMVKNSVLVAEMVSQLRICCCAAMGQWILPGRIKSAGLQPDYDKDIRTF